MTPQRCQPETAHTEAEGYAASLRQMADWVDEAVNRTAPETRRITIEDVDTDELRAAANFIDRLSAPHGACTFDGKTVSSLCEHCGPQNYCIDQGADTREAVGKLVRQLRSYNAAHLAYDLSHEEAIDIVLAALSRSSTGSDTP